MRTFKPLLVLVIVFVNLASLFSQAKKPKIMVVPSDQWCDSQGYMMEFDNQGTKTSIPDYKTALLKNYELTQVISKLGELMVDRGFPLVDLEASLKNIENETARNNVLTNQYGVGVAENPIDILNRTAKPDILLKMSWKINETGPKKSVSFNLQGIDAYSNKQVAASSGTGEPSFTAELAVLMEEAVLTYLEKFNEQLLGHFTDLGNQGREGAMSIYVWGDAMENLETEYELLGRTAELKSIINRYWMPRHTKNKRYSQDEASANVQKFSQVRIPLYGDDGWGGQIPMDFSMFGEDLAKFLKDTIGVESKVMPVGLGQVNLYIGGK